MTADSRETKAPSNRPTDRGRSEDQQDDLPLVPRSSVKSLRRHLEDTYDGNQAILQTLADCPYKDDSIDLFLLAAYFGRSYRNQTLGTVLLTPGLTNTLLEHVATKFQAFRGKTGMPFEIVSRLGDMVPFPLLRLEKALEWTTKHAPYEHADWERAGMSGPETMFNKRLGQRRYFMVIASIDPPASFEAKDLRIAKTILRGLIGAGIPVMATYEDQDSYDECLRGKLFGDTDPYLLGRF